MARLPHRPAGSHQERIAGAPFAEAGKTARTHGMKWPPAAQFSCTGTRQQELLGRRLSQSRGERTRREPSTGALDGSDWMVSDVPYILGLVPQRQCPKDAQSPVDRPRSHGCEASFSDRDRGIAAWEVDDAAFAQLLSEAPQRRGELFAIAAQRQAFRDYVAADPVEEDSILRVQRSRHERGRGFVEVLSKLGLRVVHGDQDGEHDRVFAFRSNRDWLETGPSTRPRPNISGAIGGGFLCEGVVRQR